LNRYQTSIIKLQLYSGRDLADFAPKLLLFISFYQKTAWWKVMVMSLTVG